MNRINFIPINLIFLGYHGLIIILIFSGQITFGYGLGDLFYAFLLLSEFVVFSILITFQYLKNWSKRPSFIFAIILLLSSIFYSLSSTVWRGNEYKWNGSIFCHNRNE